MRQDYQLVDPAELTPHPANPRRGDLPAIVDSIKANGFYGTIVVQASSGRVIAGNHRLLAARQLGLEQVPATFVDVDDDRALRILAVDNRANDRATYDTDALLELLTDLDATDLKLAGTGYSDDDLDFLLNGTTEQPDPEARTDPDHVPSAPAEPTTKPGDVWLLGDHRVMCGDCTDPGALDTAAGDLIIGCLLTDPPYGINLDTDYRKYGTGDFLSAGTTNKQWRPVEGDDAAFDAAPVSAHFAGVKEQFWFGGDYYRRTLPGEDREGSWLVWDKRNEESDNGFGSGFELIWSKTPHQRRVLRHYYFGAFGADTRNRVHPTQKPVPLLADILTRWAPEGRAVADPFAGSGSTLIACHRTGRTAVLMEVDPRYCDVICRRWQEHTGITPVLEATGQPHDFTAGRQSRPGGVTADA